MNKKLTFSYLSIIYIILYLHAFIMLFFEVTVILIHFLKIKKIVLNKTRLLIFFTLQLHNKKKYITKLIIFNKFSLKKKIFYLK